MKDLCDTGMISTEKLIKIKPKVNALYKRLLENFKDLDYTFDTATLNPAKSSSMPRSDYSLKSPM